MTVKRIVPVDGLADFSRYGFSQCVVSGRHVFVAGQCGLGDKNEIPGSFAEECRATLNRVRLAVEAAGGTLDDIVAMTVFVTDIRLSGEFSEIRREYFGGDFPTSALIGVSALVPPGARIEIQATAMLPEV
ncbi:RidA family protein [Streptomyces sp. NPDC090075]|uniref:RidA family protein n=1 Tax=Streptomyces sp. NPDC090075 TaxID=3365937 RepID=UPI0038209313